MFWPFFTSEIDTVKPPNNDHLSTTTTSAASRFPLLEHKGTSEQRQPVNNDHNFGVLRFDSTYKAELEPLCD
jgi:hypothetical protein